MDFLLEALTNWLKEMLVGGIMSNLSGMFDSVNQQVADISVQVGQTPQGWNGSIFNMIENLSNSIMVPIAGVILAIVMTVDLIQMIADKNNLHDVDTWMIFKWVFKSAAAILIVTNTWNIVMGVFDMAQSVVAQAAGIINSDASIDISSVMTDLEPRLMEMDLGPLFGLWFQSLFIGITMWALYICIFIVIYGRMIEIYLVTSVAPVPMAAMMGKEWGGMGQNYLRSLLALGFQAFLIIVCVAIYAVLVQNIALEDDIIMAIWSCVGYTVLLCFTLFKPAVSPNQSFRRTKTEGGFHIGLCTRTQGLNKSQNKGHVQSDQAAAYLLHGRSAYWRTAFLFAQKTYRKQCSGYVYDAGYAALLYAGYVRKAWTAAGKDRGQHSQSSCDPSKAATLPDQQLLCRIKAAGNAR